MLPRLLHLWLDLRISEPPEHIEMQTPWLPLRSTGSTQAPVGPRNLHFYKLILVLHEIREPLLTGRQTVVVQRGQH